MPSRVVVLSALLVGLMVTLASGVLPFLAVVQLKNMEQINHGLDETWESERPPHFPTAEGIEKRYVESYLFHSSASVQATDWRMGYDISKDGFFWEDRQWVPVAKYLKRNGSIRNSQYYAVFVTSGFPLRYLSGSIWYHIDSGQIQFNHRKNLFDVRGQMRAPPLGAPVNAGIPTRITWWALIANTMSYACVLLIVFMSYQYVLGLQRKRRGRCIKCGHQLYAQDVCPECGIHNRTSGTKATETA